MYLINSIPIPTKGTKIEFLIPYYNNYIEIDCPKLDNINVINLSVYSLFKYFTIDNLINIFKLLINEQKILLIGENCKLLSKVAEGLTSLLYPFKWVHTYIPIISDQMLPIFDIFSPFLIGINLSLVHLFESIFKKGKTVEENIVFYKFISYNSIKIRSSLNDKYLKFDKYMKNNIPQLPQK